MANEQTSVPLFAASEVLTAANMNLSAGTGVPVFATTVTRDAGFGGANEKVLAEGQLCYLSASNVVQYYDGAAWATVGPIASALTLISRTTIAAASTTNFNNCFTSAYTNYQIVTNLTTSANTALNMRLRASATDNTTANYNTVYYYNATYTANNGSTVNGSATSFILHSSSANRGANMNIMVANPQATDYTTLGFNNLMGDAATTTWYTFSGGSSFVLTTSFDGFSLFTGGAATVSGTVDIYGLAKS